MGIAFQFAQLRRGKITFAFDDLHIDQSSLFQRNDERRLYMAFLAIFFDNNEICVHSAAHLIKTFVIRGITPSAFPSDGWGVSR